MGTHLGTSSHGDALAEGVCVPRGNFHRDGQVVVEHVVLLVHLDTGEPRNKVKNSIEEGH